MISPTALGELLMVGSIPLAVVIAIVAAFLSTRRRRLARALMVLAVVVLAGMMLAGRYLSAPLEALRARQLERFEPLEVGWSRSQVRSALGTADLECTGEGGRGHQVRGTQELLARLYDATTERWIYFPPGAPPEDHGECLPLSADGEVGFNSQGKVIWFIELTDERFLTF